MQTIIFAYCDIITQIVNILFWWKKKEKKKNQNNTAHHRGINCNPFYNRSACRLAGPERFRRRQRYLRVFHLETDSRPGPFCAARTPFDQFRSLGSGDPYRCSDAAGPTTGRHRYRGTGILTHAYFIVMYVQDNRIPPSYRFRSPSSTQRFHASDYTRARFIRIPPVSSARPPTSAVLDQLGAPRPLFPPSVPVKITP